MSRADEIYGATMDALQAAEEMGGPEGQDYVNLMKRIAASALGRIHIYYSWRIPAMPELVAKMKVEILVDMAHGAMPYDVDSFSRLHDYVDANRYGGFCDDDFADALIDYFGDRDENEGMPQGMLNYINEAQNQIDAWLKAGRPA